MGLWVYGWYSIENFDIEKFGTVDNFLKGRSEKTNAVCLNLISILVDYQPIPYYKFKTNTDTITEVETERNNDFQDIKTIEANYGLHDQ